MPDNRRILRTLADNLPGDLLLDLFPDLSPDDVREALRTLGNSPVLTPEGESEKGSATGDGQEHPLPAGDGTCSLYTDGASRGNPGKAGAGIVLLDHDGNVLLTRSIFLGECTNNAAEYRALIAGLESALEAGCKALNIFMDSQLIVRQVQGIYRIKNEQLQPLYARVRNLLAGLGSWQIRHIPREKNLQADKLANKGIDDNHVPGVID
jgi:ribonuclease HI/probable phosphoglycerate mutase